MALKFPESLFNSKSFKATDFSSKIFNLKDNLVPERLRNAYISRNSPSPCFPEITSFSTLAVADNSSIELVVTEETKTQCNTRGFASSDVLAQISDDEDLVDEVESWEMAKMCNCGKCPIVTNKEEEKRIQMNSQNISILSLSPNLSSISFIKEPHKITSYLSISYVIPLRNYGAIIRWIAMNQNGIMGYKVFIDGIQVSSVHSPSRMSAVIENVNMKIPHHFAVSITPTSINEKLPATIHYHNMHAVYLYKPNNFIR